MVAARSVASGPSSTRSSTAPTVTACGVAQLAAVNVSVAGEKASWPAGALDGVTVTLAVGRLVSATW
jgi:hypothetical protein